jgi:hypothetical protein
MSLTPMPRGQMEMAVREQGAGVGHPLLARIDPRRKTLTTPALDDGCLLHRWGGPITPSLMLRGLIMMALMQCEARLM